MRRTLPLVVVVALGLALLAAHAWLHPQARDHVMAGVPFALRAAKLGMLAQALATLLAIDLAALAIGTPLWRRLRPAPQPLAESLPPRLAIGLLALGYLVFALAAAHVLVAPALAALVALPIVVAAPAAGRWLRAQPRLSRPRRATLGLLALAALLGATPFLDALVPRYGWDGLTYHLSVPERYLWAHQIWFSRFSLYSAFPLNVEMLYALGLGLSGTAACKLINLQLGLLALWTLALITRRASPRAAALAVAIVVADPLFTWELGVAYSDTGGLLFALLAAQALVDALPALDRRALMRLALFGGACVAVRVPALLVPVALAVVLAVGARARGARAVAGAVALVAAGVVAAMAPWWLRNAVFTGNPFAPALQRGPAPYFDPRVLAQMFAFSRSIGIGHGLGALARLPWTLFVTSSPGAYHGGFGFEVGPLYFVALVAALAVPAVRRHATFGPLLGAAGLLAIGWFFTSQEARYLLPALVFAAAAGGAALDALGTTRVRRALVWSLPLAGVALTHGPLVASLPARVVVALGPISTEAFAEREDAARVGAELRESLPPGARVLLVLEPRSFYFRGLDLIPYHVLEGSPVLGLVHDAPDGHALRCRLDALGVTHVVVNLDEGRRFHPEPIPGYGAAEYSADLERLRRFLTDWAVPVTRHGGVVAAALRPVSDCASTAEGSAPLHAGDDEPALAVVLQLDALVVHLALPAIAHLGRQLEAGVVADVDLRVMPFDLRRAGTRCCSAASSAPPCASTSTSLRPS